MKDGHSARVGVIIEEEQKMEIFKEKIYFKSIDSFFPRVHCGASPHNYSADNVVRLSDINIFTNCKCNIAIYTESGNAFYVDVRILNQSEKKKI